METQEARVVLTCVTSIHRRHVLKGLRLSWEPGTRTCVIATHAGRVIHTVGVPVDRHCIRVFLTLQGAYCQLEEPLADPVANEALAFGFTPAMRLQKANWVRTREIRTIMGDGFIFGMTDENTPACWWALNEVCPQRLRATLTWFLGSVPVRLERCA